MNHPIVISNSAKRVVQFRSLRARGKVGRIGEKKAKILGFGNLVRIVYKITHGMGFMRFNQVHSCDFF